MKSLEPDGALSGGDCFDYLARLFLPDDFECANGSRSVGRTTGVFDHLGTQMLWLDYAIAADQVLALNVVGNIDVSAPSVIRDVCGQRVEYRYANGHLIGVVELGRTGMDLFLRRQRESPLSHRPRDCGVDYEVKLHADNGPTGLIFYTYERIDTKNLLDEILDILKQLGRHGPFGPWPTRPPGDDVILN